MAGNNGASPAVEIHADPTGVFGRVGSTLALGDKQVTIRLLTNREIKAQTALINAMTYMILPGQDPGHLFYEGAMDDSRQDKPDAWAPMAAWLSAWLREPVTADDIEDATPEQVIDLINRIYEQEGLSWLRRQLGNVGQLAAQRQPEPSPESSPTGAESDSTTSTTSSSTSPDPQPIPESMSPSTD